MGSGRDKRKKLKPSAPGAGASKTERKTVAAEEKRVRRVERAAGDEDDIDALLARARLADAASTSVSVEEDCAPPSARVNVSLTAFTPGGAAGAQAARPAELLLLGGECEDEAGKTRVFSDLYRYEAAKNRWSLICSPGAPPPRSAHQAALHKHHLYVFGGEFTSPNQERFHHYRDLWRLDTSNWAWEQLTLRGAPSARSGHRMLVHKNKLLLFGGFLDTGRETRYYNDLWELDLENLRWASVGRPASGPGPRSGCCLCLHGEANSALLYGGYRKEAGEPGEVATERGVVLNDAWALDLQSYEWTKIKRVGIAPGPRSGCSMAVHRNRAVLFGGVSDREAKGGEVLISEFYNELYAFGLDTRRWYPLPLKAGASAAAPAAPSPSAAAPAAAAAPPPPAASDALHRAATRIQAHFRGYATRKVLHVYRIGGCVSEMSYAPALGFPPPSAPAPYGRIGAALAADKGAGCVWLWGGCLEVGEREVTFDDLWLLQLGAKGGAGAWQCVKPPSISKEELRAIALQEGSDDGWEEGSEDDE